ncbi:hypothetical protein P7C73_g1230, partial [Tremellales sp. Uapishka_1]
MSSFVMTAADGDDEGSPGSHRHDDPAADIVLVCEGGVPFRIDSERIRKDRYVWLTARTGIDPSSLSFANNSVFVDDLLKTANTGDPSTPIPTYVPTTTLGMYARLISTQEPPVLRDLLARCRDLFALCDRFESPRIEALILRSAYAQASSDPWGVFVLASQRDCLPLARRALSLMDEDRNAPAHDLKKLGNADVANMPSEYLLEFVKARLCGWHVRRSRRSYAEEGYLIFSNWSFIADRIFPHRRYTASGKDEWTLPLSIEDLKQDSLR